jgi:hypothetical protein
MSNDVWYRTTVLSAERQIPAVKKVLSFSDLPKGWHYGSGEKIAKAAINAALDLISLINSKGATALEVFPHVRGGVLVSGYFGGETLDVLALPEGKFSLFHETSEAVIADLPEISSPEVDEYIRELTWRPVKSSDLFTLFTTATKNLDSRAKPLNHQMTDCQSSNWTAVWQIVGTSVHTSENTTHPEFRASHQYSYDSKLTNYRQQQA